MVALAQTSDAGTDLDDLTRTLVTEHGGYGDGGGAVHRGEIGGADTGRLDAHAHLARADGRGLHVVTDLELVVADVVQDRGLHSSTSFSASARLGQESTASRTLSRSSDDGYSLWTWSSSSSSTSKTSGRMPTQTALASHSSWSTTI